MPNHEHSRFSVGHDMRTWEFHLQRIGPQMRNAKSRGNNLQTRKAEPAGENEMDGGGQPHKMTVLDHAERGLVVSAKDVHQGLGTWRGSGLFELTQGQNCTLWV